MQSNKKENKHVYKLSRYEQEVHLSFNEEEKIWTAYVTSPRYMRKFEKNGWECIDVQHYKNGEVVSKTYKAPRKCIIIAKEREKRILTEEEKNILRERILLMHEAKKRKNNNSTDTEQE